MKNYTEISHLLDELLAAYKLKFGFTRGYGGFSGFMMSMSASLLTGLNGNEYWIKHIEDKIVELREDLS
jgi:hypothetical protein